jgi:hypothetical protein
VEGAYLRGAEDHRRHGPKVQNKNKKKDQHIVHNMVLTCASAGLSCWELPASAAATAATTATPAVEARSVAVTHIPALLHCSTELEALRLPVVLPAERAERHFGADRGTGQGAHLHPMGWWGGRKVVAANKEDTCVVSAVLKGGGMHLALNAYMGLATAHWF